MPGRFEKFLDWFTFGCPRWLLLLISPALIVAGVGWIWIAGYLELPERAAELGGLAIGLGVCGLAIAILREKSDYNF